MDALLKDIRFAVRSLAGQPLLTAAAVTSLALGIGATSSIFSGIDVFLFRPLDFEEPERLVAVWTTDAEQGWSRAGSSLPDVRDWRDRGRTVDLAAWTSTGFNLAGGDRPERLRGDRVSWNFFDILRSRPALGRTFRADEETPGRGRVAILSHGLWERSFGADPRVVGQALTLDGEPYEVVGVMPEDFTVGAAGTDLWVPFTVDGEASRAARFVRVIGRLRPGASLEAASDELNRIQGELAATYPATNAAKGAHVEPLRDSFYDESFRHGSLIAGVAVLFVLLIACSNVANLLLARGAARGGEIALRSALGAGRVRIVRQLLTESLLLALLGGAAGLAVAVVGIEGVRTLLPDFLHGADDVTLNGRVMAFTAAVTLGSGVLFGLAPALQASRPDLRGTLSEEGRGAGAGPGGWLREGLVVGMVGLSTVLLVTSVLLVQAFLDLRGNELGYRTEDVLTTRLNLPETRYPDDTRVAGFQRELLAAVRSLPGVASAGATHILPMRGNSAAAAWPAEGERPPEGREPLVGLRYVTPGYFEALDIGLIAGRTFEEADRRDAPRAVVVNEVLARRHWPDGGALGERLVLSGEEWEVVGVTEGVRDGGPDREPYPVAYVPAFRFGIRSMSLVVYVPGAADGLRDAIRAEVAAMDPDQPVYNTATLAEISRDYLAGSTAMVKVLGTLALVAFLLAAVGVYGVMAYSVARRTREMGVRMALGARAGDVRRLVLRQGLVLAGVGVGGGLLVALGTSRLLGVFLYGMSPYHAPAYASVAAVLVLTAVAASWLPAVRATRVDPVRTLAG